MSSPAEAEQALAKSKSRRSSLVKFTKSLSKKLSLRKQFVPLAVCDLDNIVSQTGLERGAVESHYSHFLAHHPSGAMDPSGLRAMLSEALPGADTAGLAEHIWRMYDTNLDGSVDFREFMLALCVMRSGSAEENLRQIFRLFDINSDGRVEEDELVRVVRELTKVAEVGEEVVREAFLEMDMDRDGGVTQEEFVQAVTQHKVAATSLTLSVINIFVAQ